MATSRNDKKPAIPYPSHDPVNINQNVTNVNVGLRRIAAATVVGTMAGVGTTTWLALPPGSTRELWLLGFLGAFGATALGAVPITILSTRRASRSRRRRSEAITVSTEILRDTAANAGTALSQWSPDARTAARQSLASQAVDLLAESERIAKRRESDIVSAPYVRTAAAHLAIGRGRSIWPDLALALGTFIAGLSGGGLISIQVSHVDPGPAGGWYWWAGTILGIALIGPAIALKIRDR